MSEDRREGQSKYDRHAAASGLTRPAAQAAPATPAQHAPGGPASPRTPDVPPASVAAPAPAMPVSQAVRASAPSAAAPVAPKDGAEADDEDGSDYEEDEMPPALVERLRRLSPAPVILTIGSFGSFVFLFLSVTSHTTPVAVLMSAAVVTGLVFGLDAVIASVVTWRASQNGEAGLAFLAAIVGGIASLVSLGAFAGTLVMILVLKTKS